MHPDYCRCEPLLESIYEWFDEAGDADPNWSALEEILAAHGGRSKR